MPRYNPHKAYRTTPKRAPDPLPKGTIPSPSPVSHVPVLTENEEKDGYELRFPTKPSDEVLAKFRATRDLQSDHRWHWHFRQHFWYAKRNAVTKAFAESIVGQGSSPGVVVPDAAVAPIIAPAPVVATPSPKFAGGEIIPLSVEHKAFPKSDWVLEIQNGGTRLGYEDWVEARVTLAYEAHAEPEVAEESPVEHENILTVAFSHQPAEQPVAVNQTDWRSRFSWADNQRRRERGELPGQRGSHHFRNRE